MAGALIRFLCRKIEHQHRPRGNVSSPVTLHEQQWAFCPAGVYEGHLWERIEGETLEALKQRPAEVRVRA